MTYVLFALGLGLLIGGAELLVRGASRLAAAAGITPLVIGLTVVAFGTSSPELTVSVQSALQGDGADIALGNVVGSNIFNVLFILGVSAVITPLVVAQKLVRVDVPLMIGTSVLLLALVWDGAVGRLDGLLLFTGIFAYTAFAIWQGRKEERQVLAEYEEAFGEETPRRGGALVDLAAIAAGLALLVLGSRWLVEGAVAMARNFGVSELVISLTIIAAGTSLPEVATSVLASLRGERDIAVGNVVGSNLFNLLAVLGLSALVGSSEISVPPAARSFDIPVMIAAAAVCLPIFFTGYQIGRLEGLLFLGYYAAYVAFLILAASEHDAIEVLGPAVLYVAVPMTVLLLVVAVARQMRRRGEAEPR